MEKLEYHLQVFDGPLDLLLALIAKNKLDIYDIPIAELLDQYLEQIALMREADMDVASEFLEMAARLVQIKAASLLPQHEQDEEDPRPSSPASCWSTTSARRRRPSWRPSAPLTA